MTDLVQQGKATEYILCKYVKPKSDYAFYFDSYIIAVLIADASKVSRLIIDVNVYQQQKNACNVIKYKL